MRNESSITLEEFKQQIINQIKATTPNANVTKDNVSIQVKITEDSEPVNFYSFKVVVNF